MKLPALVAALLLAGCADISAYKPYITDIVDPKALADDETACLSRAVAYKSPLSPRAIGEAGAQGVGINAASGLLNPLAPVFGGLGYASSEFLAEIGLLSTAQRRVFLICLAHRGAKSGAYDVLDPNQ